MIKLKLTALILAATVSLAGVSAASANTKHRKHHHFQSNQSSMMGKSGPSSMGTRDVNNPTPTRNDPPGTRTQCRGGCQ